MVTGDRSKERGEQLFFRYGVGTQLMLAATSSSAKALLEDSARRCLETEEMTALTERLREVQSVGHYHAAANVFTIGPCTNCLTSFV